MKIDRGDIASLRAEPVLTVQFLPACGNCGSPHPLSLKFPPLDASKCLDCGAQVAAPPAPVDVPALIVGRSPSAFLARFLFWVGEKLRSLAKGL